MNFSHLLHKGNQRQLLAGVKEVTPCVHSIVTHRKCSFSSSSFPFRCFFIGYRFHSPFNHQFFPFLLQILLCVFENPHIIFCSNAVCLALSFGMMKCHCNHPLICLSFLKKSSRGLGIYSRTANWTCGNCP